MKFEIYIHFRQANKATSSNDSNTLNQQNSNIEQTNETNCCDDVLDINNIPMDDIIHDQFQPTEVAKETVTVENDSQIQSVDEPLNLSVRKEQQKDNHSFYEYYEVIDLTSHALDLSNPNSKM